MSDTQRPADPAGGGARTFPKGCRLLSTAGYRRVYDQGFRVNGPLFAAFCLPRSPEETASQPAVGPRLGLTVPRAVGGAVERNRIKRRLREAFRLHRTELGPQWDVVLNPRRAVLTASFADIVQALRKVIARCNVR